MHRSPASPARVQGAGGRPDTAEVGGHARNLECVSSLVQTTCETPLKHVHVTSIAILELCRILDLDHSTADAIIPSSTSCLKISRPPQLRPHTHQ